MALVGLPQFEAFSLKYPNESLYQMACQGSELLIGLGKLFCDKNGTGKFDMPRKIAQFYDITGTCMVFHDKVDFCKILKHLNTSKILIFNEKETPKCEQLIETNFPPLMKQLVKLLIDFNVGDEIPSLLSRIASQLTMSAWSLQMSKIRQVLAHDDNTVNTNEIDENSDEYAKCVEQLEQLRMNASNNSKDSLQYQARLINNE